MGECVGPALGSKGTLLDERVSDNFGGHERMRHNPTEEIVLPCDPKLGCLLQVDQRVIRDKINSAGMLEERSYSPL